MAHHQPEAHAQSTWPRQQAVAYSKPRRGRSLVGRAPPLHGGGQEFESPRLHQPARATATVASTTEHRRDTGDSRQRQPRPTHASHDGPVQTGLRVRPVLFCRARHPAAQASHSATAHAAAAGGEAGNPPGGDSAGEPHVNN